MQHKKTEIFEMIEECIKEYKLNNGGATPSTYMIAQNVGIAQSTVSKYLKAMRQKGMESIDDHRSSTSKATQVDTTETVRVPVVGSVACGCPKFAEENIEDYVRLPVSLFGRGDFFILKAKGDSMINAGIEDGDMVLIRRQVTAEYNQIVVALVEDDATLKRFRPHDDHICLHAENPLYDDIIVQECVIQGVAVNVIKYLI